MRTFRLQRDQDVTGVSGTGTVAEGVEFGDGSVAVRWLGAWPTSVVFHERGMASVERIHGHGGATRIVSDEDDPEPLEDPSDLREQLADIEHQRWAHWQAYMHGLGTRNPDGSITLPADQVARWERQITTPYDRLTSAEKASGLEQVDRYWQLVARVLRHRDSLARRCVRYHERIAAARAAIADGEDHSVILCVLADQGVAPPLTTRECQQLGELLRPAPARSE